MLPLKDAKINLLLELQHQALKLLLPAGSEGALMLIMWHVGEPLSKGSSKE
ncbi:hypothetical protein KI387_042696, partial [Taxus chinensis]